MGAITQRFATNLKTLRKTNDLTQELVAARVRISKRQYQRLEAGLCMPTEPTMERLTAALNADLAEFWR